MRGASFSGLSLLGLASTAHSISTISAYGNKFFYENGTQFYIKGVAYQLTEDDPLLDKTQCSLDAALMAELGTNTIRVYHVDSSSDHSDCMSVLADAGIYVLADLDTFDTYILPDSPWWNQTQYERFTAVMDEFQQYDNTLGFFVGNEVIAKASQSMAAPFIKAAARDLKAYRDSKGYRTIPVGYSAADIAELRPMLQDYLTCGGNVSDNVDFFSLNSYEWCGETDYSTSGYETLEGEATDFPVPIFFSETGCNTVPPRTFEDQAAIFGDEMANDWSGAIIYEWIEETNNYGLISYGPAAGTSTGSDIVGGFTRSGTPTPVSPDFTNLKTQWATLTPTGIMSSDMTTSTLSTRTCPASSSGTAAWLVNGNVALPTIGETLYNGAYTTSVPTGTNAGSASGTAASDKSSSSSSTSTSKSLGTTTSSVNKASIALAGLTLLFAVWL